jgi:hypothetical protein
MEKTTQPDYWSFCVNRLDILKNSAKPSWIWVGLPQHAPHGRIKEWLDMFIKLNEYFPSVEEITKFSPDVGSAQERFDAAIHTAYSSGFANKFGISVEGVLFTLTNEDAIHLKIPIV